MFTKLFKRKPRVGGPKQFDCVRAVTFGDTRIEFDEPVSPYYAIFKAHQPKS
jgi:hypothetical protein